MSDDFFIKTVSDYIELIKSIELKDEAQRFYRGVSNVSYVAIDTPSIFRTSKLIKNEQKMFFELVSKCPDYFEGCKNTFEHLVLMQHYRFPTRLLDITENPLVALYFACSNDEDTSGAVILYDFDKKKIKNYSSDAVAVISNLAKIPPSLNSITIRLYIETINLKNIVTKILLARLECTKLILSYNDNDNDNDNDNNLPLEVLQSFLDTNLKKILISFEDIQKEISNVKLTSDGTDKIIDEQLSKIIGNLHELESLNNDSNIVDMVLLMLRMFLNELNLLLDSLVFTLNDGILNKYFQVIKEDKNYFNCEDILYEDLSLPFCVIPKQNNPRIINQKGAFIIFGLNKENIVSRIAPSEHHSFRPKKNGKEIIIKVGNSKKDKQGILDELDKLSINSATMFPEIDNVSNYVKNKYL